MSRAKFFVELALVIVLVAGILWAVRERMELRSERLELEAEAAERSLVSNSSSLTPEPQPYGDRENGTIPYGGTTSVVPSDVDSEAEEEVGEAGAGLEKIVIGLVGDIDMPDVLKSRIEADPSLDILGGIEKVRDRLDILAGNLEAQLTTASTPTTAKSAGDIEEGLDFLLKDHPKWAAYLGRSGFSLLSVANNHALDYRWEGLKESLAALNNAGIAPVGGGADEKTARAPRFIKVRGRTIGFLAYSTVIPEGFGAEGERPGIASGRGGNKEKLGGEWREKLAGEVGKARARSDFLIVSFHWGGAGDLEPGALEREIAEVLVEAGADAVFGHGPHALQDVEMIGGVPVAFSLGDFIWHSTKETRLLELVILSTEEGDLKLGRARLHKFIIENGAPVLTGEVEVILDED